MPVSMSSMPVSDSFNAPHETTAHKSESTAPLSEKDADGPKRILVQTKTHLLRGEDYSTKLYFTLNLICQHHSNRDFLGYNNRTCYFLVDHSESAADNHVPVF
ncbi:hypothetical protein HD806DRAFT_545508 [Xylariaceae sp. AK1471]|nr:hypothetical protein HD806DRAFT_545508 [Xylariaceae sp. AK1471]